MYVIDAGELIEILEEVRKCLVGIESEYMQGYRECLAGVEKIVQANMREVENE